MGYSVGKWDNDTPVVETTRFMIGDGWTTAGIPKPNRYT